MTIWRAITRRRSTLLRLGLLAGLVVLLASCASDAPLDTLEPEGPEARTIDNLVNPVFIVAGVVFLAVEGGLIFMIMKFRRREDDDPDELPDQTHGNTALEIGWTILPAVLLAFISVATVATLFDLADEPDDAMEVRVVGQQWWWEFQYDVDGDGEHDFVTANEMVIPAGEPVNLDITSRDVIHSFWIPPLNGKRDAVPGREHPLTLEADDPGSYWGQCTEYCGLSHANMRMRVLALDDADYGAWLDNQMGDAAAPTDESAQAGLEVFESACASCHLVRGVNEDTYEGAEQVSGAAPDLTHLMTRSTFAGSIFRLYDEADDDDIAERYLELPDDGTLNQVQLEAWLRDPPGEKPMAPDPTDEALGRGMPNLELTEDQIDDLVAYLTTLK